MGLTIVKSFGNVISILIMYLICNVLISTIMLSIIYIGLTIVKSLGHSNQNWCIATRLLDHCYYAADALRLCHWCIAPRFGAFR